MNYFDYRTRFYELFTLIQALNPLPIILFEEIDRSTSYIRGIDVEEIIFTLSDKSVWSEPNFFVERKLIEEWGVTSLENQYSAYYKENSIYMKYRDLILWQSSSDNYDISNNYDIIISFNKNLY